MTTNNTETIIKYLNLYNKWRRGDEKMGQPNPTEIGKLIDEACEKLVSLERERDEWAAMCGRYKQERDEARDTLRIYRQQNVMESSWSLGISRKQEAAK